MTKVSTLILFVLELLEEIEIEGQEEEEDLFDPPGSAKFIHRDDREIMQVDETDLNQNESILEEQDKGMMDIVSLKVCISFCT
jgi:hypothetical protein